MECRDRGGEDGRGQREVDGDRFVTGQARRNGGGIGEIEPLVARRAQERRLHISVSVVGLALEPAGSPVAELLVVPVLTAGGHELEPLGEVSAGQERSQARQQVAACQVARPTEDDEPIDHVTAGSASALASVTPAEITPM